MVYHVQGDPYSIDNIKQSYTKLVLFLSTLLYTAERNSRLTEFEVACLR